MKGEQGEGGSAVRRNNFPQSRNNRFAAAAASVVVVVAAAAIAVAASVVVIAGHRDGRRRAAGEFRQVRRTTQESSIRSPSRTAQRCSTDAGKGGKKGRLASFGSRFLAARICMYVNNEREESSALSSFRWSRMHAKNKFFVLAREPRQGIAKPEGFR